MVSLPTAKRVIIFAGCLGTAYTQMSISPVTVAFARSLGASDFAIGILGALPTGVLFMQLLAAVAVTHLHHRKPLWFRITIGHRLVLLPVALGPWLCPEVPNSMWIGMLLTLSAINHALMHFASPLWLSWMGDYLPHQDLNRFWGTRELWMQWSAALAMLATALLFFRAGLEFREAFALLISIGAVVGVCDILSFIPVEEPPIERPKRIRLKKMLLAPFKQTDFRSFIFVSCFFNLASMIGAPFISLFLLDYVGMDLFHVLILWTFSWIGGAVFSKRLGLLTERFGQRPMLILCMAFKATNMLALVLLPPDPTIAFYALIPVFMFDSALNSGITIANNGFMIKHSPRENRTMFIAAGNGFGGLTGGIASIVTGAWLTHAGHWTWSCLGMTFVGFHAVFLTSLVLRLVAAVLARTVHEPASAGTHLLVLKILEDTRLRRRAA